MYYMSYGDSKIIYLVFVIFVITEIIDEILDRTFKGTTLLHSIFQTFIFMLLFIVVTRLFYIHYKSKVKTMIPEEIMMILMVLKESQIKGILINQKSLMKKIDVTKPTMKKRINTLLELGYISYEKEGNNNYIKLTPLGNSMVK
jgi:DNA-binding MarR family transcriptional regulator